MMHSLGRLILVLMLSLLLLSPAVAFDKIKVVSDNWMPYNGKPGARHEGYAVDILRTIFERKGIKVDYRERPWKRAVEEVRRGQSDMVIGALKEDLPDFIYPEKALGRTMMCFYSNTPDWKFEGVESLESVTLGIVRGYGYPNWLNDYVRRNPHRVQILHGDDAFPRSVQMLAQNRVQVIPGNQAVVNYYIKSNQLDEVIFMAGCEDNPESRELYVAFSPDNPARSRLLAEIFDQGLETLRKTGYLNHLLLKYGLKDWVTLK